MKLFIIIKMDILSLNFLMYTIAGIWRPVKWSSNCSKLYSLFTFFSISSLISLMLIQFMDIIVMTDDMESDMEAILMLSFSVVSVVFKAVAVIIRRDRIINIIQILQEKPCKACNEEEINIQMKFDRLIRSHSIKYMLLVTLSATSAITGALFDILEGKLPFNLWVPYDCSSRLSLWLTSFQVTITLLIGTIINIATETSILGICLQICAQFEILKHRLQRMVPITERMPAHFLNDTSNKSSRLSEHICHHLSIIRIAKMFNDVYSEVIFIQFFASILVICLSLYYVSSDRSTKDVASMMTYTISLFVQIFVYCWAGNEVMFKSGELSESVYQIDWTMMTINERRDLLMIMKRSTRPITLSSSFLVTLSLASYGNLLKASYSAFNVLQQS